MAKIAIINTGGTIAMSEDLTTGKVSPSSENPLNQEAVSLDNFADLEIINYSNLPSPHMTPERMLHLCQYINKIAPCFDGIVVTHGTDTLEETSYLSDLILDLEIPLVFTGAMRSSNEIGSDGLANLRSAILVATASASRGLGTLVVMNEEIHAAAYVTKTHTTNLATFQTPTFGPIGLIAKNQVLYFQKFMRRETYTIHTIRSRVPLIKAYAGLDSTFIDAAAAAQPDGLVLEGLGAGNMPPESVPGIQRLLDKGIPVVMVSRAFNGVTEDVYDYQGGGKQLAEMGVIYSQGLSGVKARIKLMVLLSYLEEKCGMGYAGDQEELEERVDAVGDDALAKDFSAVQDYKGQADDASTYDASLIEGHTSHTEHTDYTHQIHSAIKHAFRVEG